MTSPKPSPAAPVGCEVYEARDGLRRVMAEDAASEVDSLVNRLEFALAHIAILTRRLHKLADTEAAFRAGFTAGFGKSGEGWNGEYPVEWRDDQLATLQALEDDALARFIGKPDGDAP